MFCQKFCVNSSKKFEKEVCSACLLRQKIYFEVNKLIAEEDMDVRLVKNAVLRILWSALRSALLNANLKIEGLLPSQLVLIPGNEILLVFEDLNSHKCRYDNKV